jgi:hypothetical protein
LAGGSADQRVDDTHVTAALAIIAAQTAGPAELVPDLQRRLEICRGGQKLRDESR